MNLRFALFVLVLLLVAFGSAKAQDSDAPSDTLYADTTAITTDTTDIFSSPDPEFEPDDRPARGSFGLPGGGVYGGPTFEWTSLDPSKLDPVLGGQIVLYGGQGYLIVNGWLLGGMGVGATLYDLDPTYDEFSFGYGGFLTGYDLTLGSRFSIRGSLMIGSGGINMVKKRTDFVDTLNHHEILERYRQESFFALRPGISVGFSPIGFLDLRLSADYLLPFGGKRVSDLKALTYGLHVMFGIGR